MQKKLFQPMIDIVHTREKRKYHEEWERCVNSWHISANSACLDPFVSLSFHARSVSRLNWSVLNWCRLRSWNITGNEQRSAAMVSTRMRWIGCRIILGIFTIVNFRRGVTISISIRIPGTWRIISCRACNAWYTWSQRTGVSALLAATSMTVPNALKSSGSPVSPLIISKKLESTMAHNPKIPTSKGRPRPSKRREITFIRLATKLWRISIMPP